MNKEPIYDEEKKEIQIKDKTLIGLRKGTDRPDL